MVYVKYDTKEDNTTVGIPVVGIPVGGIPSVGIPGVRGPGAVPVSCAKELGGTEVEVTTEKLTEDVYAFIVVAPVFSKQFFFALLIIFHKYIFFGLLASGIQKQDIFESRRNLQVVKFFLIPVTVAMQDDLMHVYANVANITIGKEALKGSKYATKSKLALSLILRFIDGGLSLGVNFAVMLVTQDILGVFLNFAALHFLQSVDDIFFILAEQGFFGDKMEHFAKKCQNIALKKRTNGRACVRAIDTILLSATLACCIAIFGYVVSVQVARSI